MINVILIYYLVIYQFNLKLKKVYIEIINNYYFINKEFILISKNNYYFIILFK